MKKPTHFQLWLLSLPFSKQANFLFPNCKEQSCHPDLDTSLTACTCKVPALVVSVFCPQTALFVVAGTTWDTAANSHTGPLRLPILGLGITQCKLLYPAWSWLGSINHSASRYPTQCTPSSSAAMRSQKERWCQIVVPFLHQLGLSVQWQTTVGNNQEHHVCIAGAAKRATVKMKFYLNSKLRHGFTHCLWCSCVGRKRNIS